MDLEPPLLDIVVCPQCRDTLFVDDEAGELVCQACSVAYPVDANGIPVMLEDEARAL